MHLLLLVILLAFPAFAQNGHVAPGDNLVVQGIPPVPASLAAAVDRYAQFRTATVSDWHPTQRQMLIRTRFGDTLQVHVVKQPGGARTQLTFFAERVADAAYDPVAGDYFLFTRDTGGNEFYQIYRYDLAGGESTLLTDGKSRNTGGVWSTAGDRIAYQSTRRNGRDSDIYVVNPRDPQSNRLVMQAASGGWYAIDWSPDDRSLLVMEYVSINESYLWLVDVATGEKKLVTPKGASEKVAYGSAEFSTDGKAIYVTTDRDSEFRRLARLELASGRHTYLTEHIKWDVSNFDLSDDGRAIALVTNEDGLSVLRFFDTATGKEKSAPKLPVGVIGNLMWRPNNQEVAFSLASARSATDVYSVSAATGKFERWTFSETGGLNTEAFSEPELIRWKSFDGRMISGFLYRPPARFTGKRPVVISIHGGPESQFRPTFRASSNYYLNEMGVAIVYPNVRGSSGYGKTFLTLDNGFRREDSYRDIETLLDWIGTQPSLDAGRVMVTGGSYGGHMTLAVAARYSGRIACAVDVVGISNLVSFLENTESYRRDLRRAEYGDERDPKMREFLERIAPLRQASSIRKPLFVVQGKNDPRVPVSEAEQIVAALRESGTPVWYLLANDEGHGFAKKKNSDFQFYATVMFVREFLLKEQ